MKRSEHKRHRLAFLPFQLFRSSHVEGCVDDRIEPLLVVVGFNRPELGHGDVIGFVKAGPEIGPPASVRGSQKLASQAQSIEVIKRKPIDVYEMSRAETEESETSSDQEK